MSITRKKKRKTKKFYTLNSLPKFNKHKIRKLSQIITIQ